MGAPCIVCGVRLVAASELVRSSVTLHLEAKFHELEMEKEANCGGCCIVRKLRFKCTKCKKVFCEVCCQFVKEDLRFCIGCFES